MYFSDFRQNINCNRLNRNVFQKFLVFFNPNFRPKSLSDAECSGRYLVFFHPLGGVFDRICTSCRHHRRRRWKQNIRSQQLNMQRLLQHMSKLCIVGVIPYSDNFHFILVYLEVVSVLVLTESRVVNAPSYSSLASPVQFTVDLVYALVNVVYE